MDVTLSYFECELIKPSPFNRRRFMANDADDPYLVELSKSIERDGVQQPIVVRMVADDVELVAGECRLRASKLAGKPTIPGILRDLDDDAAFRICIVENAQRRNLHPLDQAAGYQAALDRGWTLDQCAAEFGVRPEFVARRAQLDKLSAKWKDLIFNPTSPVHEWSAAHLELIARLPEETQKAMLDWARRPCTLGELRGYLSRELNYLEHAPWKKDDPALVPAAGACTGCAHRSDVQPELFDRVDLTYKDGKKTLRGTQCLMPKCFENKKTAWLIQREATLRIEHQDMILVGDYWHCAVNKWKGKLQPSYDVPSFPKNSKGAKACLYVTGNRAGELFYTVPGKSSSRSSSRGASDGKPVPLADRRAKYNVLRDRIVISLIVDSLGFLDADDSTLPKLSPVQYLSVVAAFGTSSYGTAHSIKDGLDVYHRLEANSHEALHRHLFLSATQTVIGHLRAILNSNYSAPFMKPVELLCELYGLDYKAFADAAAEKKPYPKSWASLNEDGTPKTAKPKAPAKAKEKPKPSKPKVKKGAAAALKQDAAA